MADLTLAVAQSHRLAPHQTGYSRHAEKLKQRAVQSVAKKFVNVLQWGEAVQKYDPKQPRGKDGQWVETGYAKFIRTIRKPDGGFTYNPTTRKSPKAGFMVSIYKSRERKFNPGEVTGIRLSEFVARNQDLFKDRRNYLGVWHNPKTGKVYLDVSRHTRSRREAQALGNKHNQEAYFDLRAGTSIDLKDEHGRTIKLKTDTSTDWESPTGGSRQVDGRTDGSPTDAEGNRGDEENSLWRKASAILKYDPAQPRDAEGQWTKIAEGAPKDFDKAEYDRLRKAHDTHVTIAQYVQGNATYMNGTLRGEGQRARGLTPTGGYEKFEPNWEQVELLDDHMAKNPLLEDTTLTRTVPNIFLKDLNVGDVLQDDGFMSTTQDPSIISTIRKDIGHHAVSYHSTLTIQVPKGIGHINVNKELEPGHRYAHQKEIILQRGLKLQIVSKGKNEMVVKVLQ